MRVIHDLVQGSPEWHQFRFEHNGASEIAAALGLSKLITRNELLRAKHTGNPREFGDWVQRNVLDKGHEVEAKARVIIEEEVIEDSLYPITCSDGKLSASCDGITIDDVTAWECKQWNEELAEQVLQGRVPDSHMPQCQQVLMVTCAKRLLFTVSDGTPRRTFSVEVLPDQAWFDRIVAGWVQFEKDLAEYVPTEAVDKPTGTAPDRLPALRIEISGQVTASNLSEFKQTALLAIRAVNRELKTDKDFADAAESMKWCDDVESRLEAAKEHALSQTATIDQLFKTIDEISAEARRVRLDLNTLVTRRKTEIKDGITLKARQSYDAHIASLKAETEGLWLPIGPPDFALAAKNKRTIESLHNAVDTALANGKITADASAKSIRERLAVLKADGAGYELLFADKAALIAKPVDDLRLVIKTRIDAQRAAESVRDALAPGMAVIVAAPPAAAPVRFVSVASIRHVDDRPPITTGAVCDRLGFALTTAFIEGLGITPAPKPSAGEGKIRTGTFWHEADFPRICSALIAHVQSVAQPVTA